MEASSAVNTPHPDDPTAEEADAFFGSEETAEEPTGEPGAEGEQEQEATVEETADEQPAGAEEQPAEQEPESGQAEPAPASVDADTSRARGAPEREYVVFQAIGLTEKVLRSLLGELEKGTQVRTVLFELHRTNARNVNGAIADAYLTHRERLGEKVDMAAVSAKSLQTRHVEPKQRVVESALSIS